MSAIPGELKLLRSRLDAKDVVLVESGIGKVNAAVVTTQLILQHKPEVILFTGVAGGLDSERCGDRGAFDPARRRSQV